MGWALFSLYLHTFSVLHDFHYSRTDVVYAEESRTWQVTMRVFTDDFEAALERRVPSGGPMRLGDARERPDAAAVAAVWASETFVLQAGGKRIPVHWVGMDVAHDLTYIFLETKPGAAAKAKELRIRNAAFFDQFTDQINEVNVRFGTATTKRALDRSQPEDAFPLR